MDTPQEVEVWFVLPALRKEFALALKRQGLKQKEIAGLLDITEPAVSQYLRGKRGEILCFSDAVKSSIEKSSMKLVEGKTTFSVEFQKILRVIKKSKFICGVCRDKISTPNNCEICYR